MKWISYFEKEPEDKQWILVFQDVHKEFKDRLTPMIKFIEYTKYGNAWEQLRKDREEWNGWTHWIAYKDFKFPEGYKMVDKAKK